MTASVDLPEALERFVTDEVEAGKYGSKSEVIRDALRLLMRQEASIDPQMVSEEVQEDIEESLEQIEKDQKVSLSDVKQRYEID